MIFLFNGSFQVVNVDLNGKLNVNLYVNNRFAFNNYNIKFKSVVYSISTSEKQRYCQDSERE